MLIAPVSVVISLLSFLSVICERTPPHKCSIACIAISLQQGTNYEDKWIWDPTLSGILNQSGFIVILIQGKLGWLRTAPTMKYITNLEKVMCLQNFVFGIAKQQCSHIFSVIRPLKPGKIPVLLDQSWNYFCTFSPNSKLTYCESFVNSSFVDLANAMSRFMKMLLDLIW